MSKMFSLFCHNNSFILPFLLFRNSSSPRPQGGELDGGLAHSRQRPVKCSRPRPRRPPPLLARRRGRVSQVAARGAGQRRPPRRGPLPAPDWFVVEFVSAVVFPAGVVVVFADAAASSAGEQQFFCFLNEVLSFCSLEK